jgi:hypothetical protein
MIKVIEEKTFKRFSDALAITIYPHIYVRKGWENTSWLIEHEKLHLKEQKEKGQLRWLFKYLTNSEFRYWAEVRAYKVSIKHGLNPEKAIWWIYNNYRLNVSKNQVRADLAK